MAYESGKGFRVVKVLTTVPAIKNYIRVKQVDDLTIKNYVNVKETDGLSKDYVNVVVVPHDTPKDYLRVNFVAFGDNDFDQLDFNAGDFA